MKPGLAKGAQHILRVTVTPDMVVEFEGQSLHPFYPTYWACHHAELACRRLLEPYLEPHEDGIGSGLFIHHHAPALAGQLVCVVATVTRVRERHLACHFEMTERGRRIAHGDVHQVIVAKSRLKTMAEHAALGLSALNTDLPLK